MARCNVGRTSKVSAVKAVMYNSAWTGRRPHHENQNSKKKSDIYVSGAQNVCLMTLYSIVVNVVVWSSFFNLHSSINYIASLKRLAQPHHPQFSILYYACSR